MSYSALNAVDESKITRLGFKAEPCNYVYATPDDSKNTGIIYEVEDSTYEKAKEILKGNSAHSISKGDKVYVLPGHPLAMNRIQEYLKRIGANVTKNVNIATIIAGTDEFYVSLKWQEQAKFLHMMMSWSDGFKIIDNVPEELEVSYSLLHSDIDKSLATYIAGPIARYISSDPNISMVGDEINFMTPLSIDVLYNVLSRRLKVVTAETICDDANSELKLADKETYFSVSSMLKSNDSANHKLGLSILFHSDLRGEIRYTVWKLASAFRNIVSYADKSKSRDYFLERTDWNAYASMDKEDFLNKAFNEGFLTQEMLNDLVPQLQNEHVGHILTQVDEDFYNWEKLENGDIIVRLKDKWKEIEPVKIEENELIQI